MNKLQFKETTELNDFTKRCLMNEYKGADKVQLIKEYWRKAKNVEQFKDMVLNDKTLNNLQGYWELAKEDYCRERHLALNMLIDLCDEHFKTYSDIGSLKIGNDSFAFNVDNLYGDGENDVFIINKNVDLECLKFETTIEGDSINIYSYDCGGDVLTTLRGKYAIYKGKRIFAFVKW